MTRTHGPSMNRARAREVVDKLGIAVVESDDHSLLLERSSGTESERWRVYTNGGITGGSDSAWIAPFTPADLVGRGARTRGPFWNKGQLEKALRHWRTELQKAPTATPEAAQMPAPPIHGPIYVKWLLGGCCLRFETSCRFGQSGDHRLSVDVSRGELAEVAAVLRADPSMASHAYQSVIRRGRGQQLVPIWVSRDLLLGIADAIASAVDDRDAGHLFWHWEERRPRPCSDCRETQEAEDQQNLAARRAFLARWSQRLHVSVADVEALLAEHQELPRRRRSSW